jgi:hypothetical protein
LGDLWRHIVFDSIAGTFAGERGFALLAPIHGVETTVVDRSKGCAQTTACEGCCEAAPVVTAR